MPPVLSRALALILLAIIPWIVYALVVAPIVAAYARYGTSIERSQALLQRYERLDGAVPRVEAQLAALRGARPAAVGFLEAASETLAQADMQNRLKTSIEAAGGGLKSLQALPAKQEGDAQQVSVRVQMSGGTEALEKLLYAIETANPFLFVDNLDIQARRERRDKGDDEEAINLDTRFDVTGFLRGAQP